MHALLVLLTTLQIFNQPVNDQYRIRIIRDYTRDYSVVRVLLVDRANANRFWELGLLDAPADNLTVDRIDENSIVLSSRSDYGILDSSYKLFFNISAKQIVKQVPFKPMDAIMEITDKEALRVGIPPNFFKQLRVATAFSEELELPDTLKTHPLPRTTYAQFAKARPKQAEPDDASELDPLIEDGIGALQIVGNRIWLGKNFYDGEGHHGVGGLGYFDTTSGKYTFLQVPQVIDWSVSALLVEDNTVWAALVHHPEGEDYSGGLLRYDLKSGSTRVYRAGDVIRKIIRSENTLFLGTAYGIYALTNDTLVRHRAEPNRTGGFSLVTEKP